MQCFSRNKQRKETRKQKEQVMDNINAIAKVLWARVEPKPAVIQAGTGKEFQDLVFEVRNMIDDVEELETKNGVDITKE